MSEAYICDAVRTPFGRYGGALAYSETQLGPANPWSYIGLAPAAVFGAILGCIATQNVY